MLVEGDRRLFNQYGVMAVARAASACEGGGGGALHRWLASPAGQAAIAGYRIGGEQLFFPNAGDPDA